MPSRLDDIPVYEYKTGEIESHYYNHVQIALKRIGKQIRIEIPGLKHLDLILDQEAWIIVDRVHADVPIAAWSDFDAQKRESLSTPINCTIRTYHQNADLIMQRTLDSMETFIDEELAKGYEPDTDKVINITKKSDQNTRNAHL